LHRSGRWVLVLVLTACSDASEPEPPAFKLAPEVQWSGGSLTIQSVYFRGLATLPAATVADVPVDLTRVDDSTLSARLPTLPTQTAAVEVISGSIHIPVGTVAIIGFRALKQVNPDVVFEPVIASSPNGPVAIGGIYPQPLTGAIGIVDLRTAQIRVESGVSPVDFFDGHGAGVTYDPTRLILRDSTGKIGEWQFTPTLAYVDSVPPGGAFSRNLARLSEQVWLFEFNHVTNVIRASSPSFGVAFEDPFRARLSVAADRAILGAWYGEPGAVVFRMSTGDTLYRLPISSPVVDAAFTADGLTLYVVGWVSNTPKILSVTAATGAVTGQILLSPDEGTSAIALDATASHLFVTAFHDPPVVLVYDTETLALVGRLQALPDATCVFPGYDVSMTVDDGSATVFVVNGTSGTTCIWEFDMLP
jgi:hypothetical protein